MIKTSDRPVHALNSTAALSAKNNPRISKRAANLGEQPADDGAQTALSL